MSAIRPGGDTDPARHARPVAAGGWRRAVTGAAVGVAAGLLLGLVLPRDGEPAGQRRGAGPR
jgi:hypothetical protein